MKKSLLLVSLLGVSTVAFSNVNIKSLDIYKNRTFVNQQLNILDNSVDLLGNIRFEDIRFIVDGECKIGQSSISSNNYSNDSLSSEIKQLKQTIAFKENEIKSVNNSIQTLSNIRFEKEAVSLDNIKNVSSYAKKQLLESYNLVFKLNEELKEYNNKLRVLVQKKNSNKYANLQYKTTCESGSKIYVNYPVSNIRVNSFYEINANSENQKVDIKNSSFLTQSSGYDFKNVDINLYTYNFSNQINPTLFYPKYLDIYEAPIAYMQADSEMMMEKAVVKKVKRAKLSSTPYYSYNETTTKSFFKASNITLESGVKTPVTFANVSYKMKDSIEIDGFATAKAFYKVEFKSDKLFSRQNSKLYLDGVFIGNSFQKEIKKDKDSSFYFSEDRFIDVKKELLKDMKEEPFFSISKIKTEKLWQYTITNNHKSKKTITLVERLPVSKHEDIKVKLISNVKYTKKEANGKISYDFVLKPNESKIIEFGYEVEKPYKK